MHHKCKSFDEVLPKLAKMLYDWAVTDHAWLSVCIYVAGRWPFSSAAQPCRGMPGMVALRK